MRTRSLPVWPAVLLSLASCELQTIGPNLNEGTPTYAIMAVKVTPLVDTAFIRAGAPFLEPVQLTAQAYSHADQVIPSLRFVWRSSNTGIALVDSTGLVTPQSPGTVTIFASAGKIGHATVVVLLAP
jgi:hypothetical protein